MTKRIKPKWQIEKEKARKNIKASVNTNASQAFKSLGDALSKILNNLKNKWADVEQRCDALSTKRTTSKLDMLEARQNDIEQQLNHLDSLDN